MLSYGRAQEVLPVFDLTLLYNRGAAFSFLSDAGGWQRWMFSVLSAAVSIFLIIEIPRQKSLYSRLAFAMILSGALGNLIDRVRLGYVIDFVHVHWQEHYFPAFNLADAAISIGVCFLLIDWYLIERKEKNA
jgi:signal peptidase II